MPKQKWNINYAKGEKQISYSQYSIYKQCNYRWYLDYIKNLRTYQPSINTLFGTSFHETIQEYLRVMYSESIKAADALDLESFLKTRMIENYAEDLKNPKILSKNYTTKEQFNDFIQDGVNILNWFKKKRAKYFSNKTDKLVGIEIPFEIVVTDKRPKIIMTGLMDWVLYSKIVDTHTIYDCKTSTSGWRESDKKDSLKIDQLLFYKYFYSKKLKIPLENIDVQFLVVKRKPFISEDYPTYWIQEIVPAQGKKKVETAIKELEDFVVNSFTEDNKYNIDREYTKNFNACKFCPYKDNDELCSKK